MARRTRGGASSRRADPAPVSAILGDLVAERGWQRNLALGRLKAAWAEVVGPQVAARSEPLKLDSGRLTIGVEAGAWAAELALMGGQIAESAAHFLGPDLVGEVAIVARAPRPRPGPSTDAF
jgi:predicted nucleic acid-binding Zn ribbon protein